MGRQSSLGLHMYAPHRTWGQQGVKGGGGGGEEQGGWGGNENDEYLLQF